jgi:hypothetical protein
MQQLNPSEISEIIKSRIAKLDTSTEARNEGTSYPYPMVSCVFMVWPT